MKRPDIRKYLYDILQACDLLERFTKGKAFDDYSADALLRSGVERRFGIVREALAQAPRVDPDIAERIAGTSRIIAFRNRLVHGYASVVDEVVWGVLETNLPALRRDVRNLLEECSGEEELPKG
ncbi:MAG: HepT-like ribonuclease domain-containing protein [Planctomycetota bacterium]|jgi:uncharacterized protein with HEPN domain